MERRHLRYMIALAEERGFTRAAERVGIAQPPFSRQIKDIERELATQLVRRTPKGAVLTPAGEALVKRAHEIEDLFAVTAVEVRRVGDGLTGLLRVGFTESSIFHPSVAQAILAFRHAAPNIELQLREGLSTDLIASAGLGELDAAFVRPPLRLNDGWIRHSVAEEGMVVALPIGHALGRKPSLRLEDLSAETFILYHRRVRPGLTDAILSACERAGFEPATTQVVPKTSSALALVATGAGITIVPGSLAKMAVNGLIFVPLANGALHAKILLIWAKARESQAIRRLKDLACRPPTGAAREAASVKS